MSNLIKGYSAKNSEPFIIDANKSELAIQIDQQCMQERQNLHLDADGFAQGLSASALSPEELQQYEENHGGSDSAQDAQRVENVELAREAAQVIEEARQEAAAIVAQAQARVEDITAQSRLAGHEEGYQQGLADAAAQMEQKKAELEQEQEAFKQAQRQELEQAQQELEPRFTQVLCDLLERLTGVVVTGHREVLLYLINNAMRGIDNSHSFVISVSEADFDYVNKHQKEIYGYLNPGVTIELFQDAQLSKNQCKIETEGGIVDVSLDVQLSQMIKNLMMLSV